MNAALTLNKLKIRFKQFTLGPLSLTLEPGRVYGLVGPNGSGKTTTLRCIAGNLAPDAGGFDVADIPASPHDGKWKEPIGYVSDDPVFYEFMTGNAYLKFMKGFYPSWSDSFTTELAQRFTLDLKKKVKHLSKGNRLKLALIGALAHRPKLALFDEPTAGLDPMVRTEVFEVLWEMMEKEDMTILYSTHILDDLHKLADELVFLVNGQIIAKTPKDDLLDTWRKFAIRTEKLPDGLECVYTAKKNAHEWVLVSHNGDQTLQSLHEAGFNQITATPLTLEEIAVNILKGKSHGQPVVE